MLSTWLNFGEILKFYFLAIFSVKFLIRFLQLKIIFAIFKGWLVQLMWNKKEINELDAMLTRLPLTLTFDLDFLRLNCILEMGGSIVMGRKGRESIGCPDVKH